MRRFRWLPWLSSSLAVAGISVLVGPSPLRAEAVDETKVKAALMQRFDENRNDKLDAGEAQQARARMRNLLEDKSEREISIPTWREDVRDLLLSLDADTDNRLSILECEDGRNLLDRLIPKVATDGPKDREATQSKPTTKKEKESPRANVRPRLSSSSGPRSLGSSGGVQSGSPRSRLWLSEYFGPTTNGSGQSMGGGGFGNSQGFGGGGAGGGAMSGGAGSMSGGSDMASAGGMTNGRPGAGDPGSSGGLGAAGGSAMSSQSSFAGAMSGIGGGVSSGFGGGASTSLTGPTAPGQSSGFGSESVGSSGASYGASPSGGMPPTAPPSAQGGTAPTTGQGPISDTPSAPGSAPGGPPSGTPGAPTGGTPGAPAGGTPGGPPGGTTPTPPSDGLGGGMPPPTTGGSSGSGGTTTVPPNPMPNF